MAHYYLVLYMSRITYDKLIVCWGSVPEPWEGSDVSSQLLCSLAETSAIVLSAILGLGGNSMFLITVKFQAGLLKSS